MEISESATYISYITAYLPIIIVTTPLLLLGILIYLFKRKGR
ncbi:hypothetical protein [Gottfriedia sp. OAE603]